MKDRYIFPAIFNFEYDGISIEFPDLKGCLSCADSNEEALNNSKEVLGLFLFSMERDDEEIPIPTNIRDIKIESNQVITLIEVYMPVVRNEINNKSVKKTLTIPQWLNDVAEKENINFSQVLQEALKSKLGL